MVSIVFTWNFKFYIAFYNFYIYKQSFYIVRHTEKIKIIESNIKLKIPCKYYGKPFQSMTPMWNLDMKEKSW